MKSAKLEYKTKGSTITVIIDKDHSVVIKDASDNVLVKIEYEFVWDLLWEHAWNKRKSKANIRPSLVRRFKQILGLNPVQ